MERQIAVNPNVGIQEYTIKPGDSPIRIARNLGWNNEQSVVQAIRDTYGDYTSTYKQLMRKYMHPGVKINIGDAVGEIQPTVVTAEIPQHLKVAAGDAVRSGAKKITDFPEASRGAIMEGVGAPSNEAALMAAPLVLGANPVAYALGDFTVKTVGAVTDAIRNADNLDNREYKSLANIYAPQARVSISSENFRAKHPYLALAIDAGVGAAGAAAASGITNLAVNGPRTYMAQPNGSYTTLRFRPGTVPEEFSGNVVGKGKTVDFVPQKSTSSTVKTTQSYMGGNGQTVTKQATARTGGQKYGPSKAPNPRGQRLYQDVQVIIPPTEPVVEAPVPPSYFVPLYIKPKNYVEVPIEPTEADRESVRTKASPWMRQGTFVQGSYKPAATKTYTATYDRSTSDSDGNPSYKVTEVIEEKPAIPSDRYVPKFYGEHGRWRTTPGNNLLIIK